MESNYTGLLSAFVLQLVFVLFVFFGYSWIFMIPQAGRVPTWGQSVPKHLRLMIRVSLCLSVFGTFFLLYDKVVIQGIDYSHGVAVAREAWRKEGVSRGGQVSSIYSVLGYLLSSGYFVAGVLLVIGGKHLSQGQKYRIALLIFILLMLNSILAGGRSNVLLLAVFLVGASTSVSGWSYKALFSSVFVRWSIFLFIFLAAWYLLYVFSARAQATGIDIPNYVSGFLPYLGLSFDYNSELFREGGVISDIASLLVLAFSYVTHSFSTTAAILEHGVGDKTIIFLHPMNILFKLGLTSKPDSAWFLSGRFPSLPGALFYQFGIFGFFVISLFLGFLGGLSRFAYLRSPSNILFIGFYLAMYSVLILSPLLLAIDFMSFPFVISSFVLIFLLVFCLNFLRLIARRAS